MELPDFTIYTSIFYTLETPSETCESTEIAPGMCHFTKIFFDCGHQGEDNARGCYRWRRTGDLCNIDDPQVRRREDCSIVSEDRNSLCPACEQTMLARIEMEEYEKDLEKARLQSLEEQKQKQDQLETHVRQFQESSMAEMERQYRETMDRVMKESAQQAQQGLFSQETSIFGSAMEASRKEYEQSMVDRFGESVEDGSLRMDVLKRKSTMDWHHERWGEGSEASHSQTSGSTLQGGSSGDMMGQLQMKMQSSFSMKDGFHTEVHLHDEGHHHIPLPPPMPSSMHGRSSFGARFGSSARSIASSSSSHTAISPPPPLAPPLLSTHSSQSRILAHSSTMGSSSVHATPPPPPPLPPVSTTSNLSTRSAHSSSTTQGKTVTSSAPPPPPAPPLPPSVSSIRSASSRSAAGDASLLAKIRVRANVSPTPSLPGPSTPTPSSPPLDYSQSPKDQNYGRFMIGTRHQPIHPSQEMQDASTPASPTSPTARRGPAPSVRLASTVAPTSPSPASFSTVPGDQRSRLRSTASGKRPAPKPPATSEQVPSELQAILNRRRIASEAEEEGDGIEAASVTPSQSASQIPTRASSHVGEMAEDDGDPQNEAESRNRRVAFMNQKRRSGWSEQ